MKKTFNCALSLKNGDTEGIFNGYASVFGVLDSQGEKVASGAFDYSLKAWIQMGKMPKLLWQHDYRYPIGVWQEIYEDAHGLFVKGQLLLELKQGREAYSLLKNGVIDGLSIGFSTVRARRVGGRAGTPRVRVLEEVTLHEISLVTFAANPKAKVNQIKMIDLEMETLIESIHQLGNVLNNEKERKAS